MVIRRKKEFTVTGWIVLSRKKPGKALNVYSYKGKDRVCLTDRSNAFVFRTGDEVRTNVFSYINSHKTPLRLADFQAVKVAKAVLTKETVRECDWQRSDHGRPLADPDPLAPVFGDPVNMMVDLEPHIIF